MTGLRTLIGKELREAWRTRRFPVVVILFAGIGILSILTARYLPEILELALGEHAGAIPIPEPTVIDAVAELLGNAGQLGALAAIVLAMGAVATERERGTAAFVLSKPASRGAFLGAKVIALGAVLAAAVAVALAVSWAYSAVLFEPPGIAGWLAMGGLAWLGLATWTSITFLASTVLRSAAAAAGVGVVALIGLSLASAIPPIGRWLPASLDRAAIALAGGGALEAAGLASAVAGSCLIIAVSLLAAWLSFRHQEL